MGPTSWSLPGGAIALDKPETQKGGSLKKNVSGLFRTPKNEEARADKGELNPKKGASGSMEAKPGAGRLMSLHKEKERLDHSL